MQELEERAVQCPYCGETIDILLDTSVPQQNYIEDCQVCCRPITVDVTVGYDGEVSVFLLNENE
ncbi:CPXCG motif-containing cysteine-rich protein [uncultured Paraglaciecola sp.]|uniref:CPXCG motif-containing cysteine-rich protein n=1 Tax=uncultured Paraglaciecola sp. TaxID=1765024 RepID=UPI0025DC682B|nr:CPXCG motif-containing cysteine-rich protein [uncultured Paraglaciecola sp.]